MTMLRITTLMDNRPSAQEGIIAEHGLSFYVEYGKRRMLFDCGCSGNFLHNARVLGVDLKHLDCVILSHSHYDHAGGFRHLTQAGMGSKELYIGAGFFSGKFSLDQRGCRDLSAGFDQRFLAEWGIRCHTVTDAECIFPGAYILSGFPRNQDFETIPARFVRKTEGGFVQDDFGDEVCLALEIEGGIALLVGCAHPGILNMVSHVRKRLDKPIRAVFGGTHLVEADDQRVCVTVARLKDMGVELLGMNHCSGDRAEGAIGAMPGIRNCYLAVGDRISLD